MIAIPVVVIAAFVLCLIQNARAGSALARYLKEKNPPEYEPYKPPPLFYNNFSAIAFLYSSAASRLAARDPAFAPVLAACRWGCLYLPLWFVGSAAFMIVAGYLIGRWSPAP